MYRMNNRNLKPKKIVAKFKLHSQLQKKGGG